MHTRSFPRILGLTVVITILCAAFGSDLNAQSSRLQHQVIKKNKTFGPALGRDLWFTMVENYQWSSAGKYYDLYVTSPAATTVNIQVAGAGVIRRPIEAERVVTFRIPLAWELKESGKIEKKAIHVWSDDADLSAYVLSRNPATSDGMYIIPSIGWGTEYVVAAFHSHWAGGGFPYGETGDLPSEFAVIANQDNTEVSIMPTTDTRAGQNADAVLYPKDKEIRLVLNRGEAVQFQATRNDGNAEGYDYTGTVIKSSKPIGVVGGNMCANVPVEFPWCDHICDMIPPVRTWANTYYTAPFIARKGGDGFLVIASEDNQTINRVSQSGSRIHAVLNKHEYFFRHDIDEASRWESDKPFLLAQYCNSTSWPDYPTKVTNDGIGDPAYTVVNSVEQFVPKVVFQTPTILGGESQFKNYVNVIVHKNALTRSKYDGRSLAGAGGTTMPIAGDWLVYRFSNVSPGTHIVESDSGAGVYIYGYGSYDSYAWTGGFGNKTFRTQDTISPAVETPGNCFCATINITDIHDKASKLSSIVLDSSYNMNFDPDLDFIPGAGIERSLYNICVTDSMKEAYIRVVIHDIAGNETIVISKYQPQVATISPPITNFGEGEINGAEIVKEVTITNVGKTDFSFTELRLKFGNVGFRIVSADLSPLRPGETRKVMVGFIAREARTVTDTILFGDQCVLNKAVVIGNGGAADYVANDVEMGPIMVGTVWDSDQPTKVNPPTGVEIQNPSSVDVVIDDITLENNVQFRFDKTHPKNQLPITVPPGGKHEVVFEYRPDAIDRIATRARFIPKPGSGLVEKTYEVAGRAWAPGATIVKNDTTLTTCPTGQNEEFFQFQITVTGTTGSQIHIASVERQGDPQHLQYFSDLVLEDQGRNPVTIPGTFPKDYVILVRTKFTPPANTTGKFEMTVVMKDSTGKVLDNGSVTATAFTEFRDYTITPPILNFPRTAYGSAPVRRAVTVTNTSDLEITLNDIPFAQNRGSHPGSFRVIPPTGTWPIVIPAKQSLNVEIEFDPSKDAAALQGANYLASAVSCYNHGFSVSAPVTVGGFSAQAMAPPAVFSCVVGNQDVEVRGAGSPSGSLTWTIGGANAANFTTTLQQPQSLKDLEQLTIPVTFLPDANSGLVAYQADMTLVYLNAQNERSEITVQLAGTAGGIVADFTSRFATPTARVGDELDLPIMVSFTKALPTLTVEQANIRKLRVRYEFNTDLLSILNDDIAAAVRNLPNGWSVNRAESSVGAGQLTLVLDGTAPLPETAKIGDIHFFVRLPNKDDNDDLKMTSLEMYDQAGNSYANCVQASTDGGTFNLIYQCGDKVLQELMSGTGRFSDIAPPQPNPVHVSGIVTFRYGNRVETPVSIIIYDVLGKEVDRVIDNVVHPVGTYEVKYSTKHLQSGSYTYQFVTSEDRISDRLVIEK